jgi:hypothetical protein
MVEQPPASLAGLPSSVRELERIALPSGLLEEAPVEEVVYVQAYPKAPVFAVVSVAQLYGETGQL